MWGQSIYTVRSISLLDHAEEFCICSGNYSNKSHQYCCETQWISPPFFFFYIWINNPFRISARQILLTHQETISWMPTIRNRVYYKLLSNICKIFTSSASILFSFSSICFLSNIISADAGFSLGSKVFITWTRQNKSITSQVDSQQLCISSAQRRNVRTGWALARLLHCTTESKGILTAPQAQLKPYLFSQT